MALSGSLPHINLGVQGVTQGGHHKSRLSPEISPPFEENHAFSRIETIPNLYPISREFRHPLANPKSDFTLTNNSTTYPVRRAGFLEITIPW
ncbi:hypothetical protein TNCV_5094861 [Trichonephila clavipes]|nr:hypothetical protein TNCV_5094861 [Trichonephila clavipes]